MLNSPVRQRAKEKAQQILSANPLYLDTETTGLKSSDEIIEISVIDDTGTTMFEALVKPSRPIPMDATMVHGIRNADVLNARSWPIIWMQVREVLRDRVVVMYNTEFDLRMMQQSYTLYRLSWEKIRFTAFDLLKLYAEFRGDWDGRRGSYRYHSLADAGRQCGINLPNAHRATKDTLLTRALLHYIADAE